MYNKLVMSYSKIKTRQGVRLYKMSRTAPWTYRKHRAGKNYYFQLGNDTTEAGKMANEIHNYLYFHTMEDALDKYQPDKHRAGRKGVPTFADLADTLEGLSGATGTAKRTLEGYVSSLRIFARLARPSASDEKAMASPVSSLTPALIIKMRKQLFKGIADEEELRRKMRTANSRQRNCSACFGRTFKSFMSEYDLSSVQDFLEVPLLAKLQKKYELPDPGLIEKTFELYHSYSGPEKILLGLALFFGMRREEIFNCRSRWFRFTEDRVLVTIKSEITFRPKSGIAGTTWGSKGIATEILDEAPDSGYLILKRKRDGAAKKVVKDLRNLGWDRNSPLHECRKLYGSYLANKEGLYAAQKALRHSSPQVTSDAYADIMLDDKIIQFWEAA